MINISFFATRECIRGNAFGRALSVYVCVSLSLCMFVCLSLCSVLCFESFYLEGSFWYAGTSSEFSD